MIAETSRQAYAGIQKTLGARQQEVYDAIGELGVASNEAISDALKLPINCVTPRVNELHRYGMLANAGLTRNKSGVSAKLWCIKDINDSKLELDCGE